jgi:hypothetical protein
MATIIPGWNPSPQRQFLTPAVLTSITQVLSATSTAATIAFPASIIAGDLIILVDRAQNTQFSGTLPTDVTPSGFTRVGASLTLNASAGDFFGTRQNLWYKLAAGTETGNLTGMDGTNADKKAMYVFRGNIPATAITVGDAEGSIIDTNPTALNCQASGGVAPLVVIGAYGSSAAIDPRTFSTTKGGEINPDTQLYLAYKIYNSSPADSSIDMDDEGFRNTLQSAYFRMT